jgi:Xaa-Pro aminopeptidase
MVSDGLSPSFLGRKIELVQKVMEELEIDLWVVFTRDGAPDPVAGDIGLEGVMARTAGIIDVNGDKCAIAWSPDAEAIKQRGFYDKVLSYEDEGVSPKIREFILNRKPRRIGVNSSRDFGVADGLTHTMRRYLEEAVGEYAGRLVSAEDLVIAFRSRLLPEEVELVKGAISRCEDILETAAEGIIRAGKTDRQIHEEILGEVRRAGLETAWSEAGCPSVIVGADPVGHVGYNNSVVEKGKLVRLDFGVKYSGYCCDLQHVYFVGAEPIPREDQIMFETACRANDAAIASIRPGVPGYIPDQAARRVVLEAGYPNYWHGTGHPVGRLVHEVGPRLAPKDSKDYAAAASKLLQPGMALTVEPSVFGKNGMCNLEQDVLVTPSGAECLSKRQPTITVIG